MAIFKPPRGSDETLKSFILEKGEIVYNTTDGKFYTGDDETLGGVLLNGGSSTPAPEQGGVTMDEVTDAILSALDAHATEADDKYATKAEVSTKIGNADLDPIRIELEKKLEAKDIESKLDSSTFDTWTENVNALYASKYALSQASKEIEDLKGENVALKADHAADVASLKAEIKANKVAAKVAPFIPGTATTDADEVYMDSSVELTTNTVLSAKNLVIDNANISAESGSVFEATVKDTFDVTDATFTSNASKSANVAKVKDAETVIIKDTTFTGNSYNTLMTGQNCAEGKYIKNMVIENCKFEDVCAHIYIWFAAFLDGATLTIKNCTFKDCEQLLCISDFQGSFDNKLTVVIKDCTVERYDNYKPNNNGWYGLILCDSRKVPAGQFEALNPFGDGKVTIYIDNVVAGGTKLTQDNFKMGVDGTDQMLYIYKANERANVSMSEETKHLFPTVIIK